MKSLLPNILVRPAARRKIFLWPMGSKRLDSTDLGGSSLCGGPRSLPATFMLWQLSWELSTWEDKPRTVRASEDLDFSL